MLFVFLFFLSYPRNKMIRISTDLSEVTDLLMSHFHKNLNDEVDGLRRVAVNLHKKKVKIRLTKRLLQVF